MTRWLVVCIAIIVWIALPLHAQDTATTLLTYDTPMQGVISASNATQVWTINALGSDALQIEVVRMDGNLLPRMIVTDENGGSIANASADETGARAVLNVTMPRAGMYVIEVESGDGESAGRYSLNVMALATGRDHPNNQTTIGDIYAEVPISNALTPSHWEQRYTFVAAGADIIRLYAARMSGTLLPEIRIVNSVGAVIASAAPDETGAQADTGAVRLASAGEYTVILTRAQGFDGRTHGEYVLRLETLGAGRDNATLAVEAGSLRYDSPVSGSISGGRWAEDWRLVADAADVISIDVERAGDGDTLQPIIILLDENQRELSRALPDASAAQATIARYALPSAGTYTIRVSRVSEQDGSTRGRYQLTARLDGAGAESASLSARPADLTLGVRAQYTLSPQRWRETLTFRLADAQIVTIEVERANGTLMPRLLLLDANGRTIAQGSTSRSRDRAVIEAITLAAGQYQLVVERDGAQQGYTSGAFSIVVLPS
jgi:hypothetical protein